jgi:hypothetical protein
MDTEPEQVIYDAVCGFFRAREELDRLEAEAQRQRDIIADHETQIGLVACVPRFTVDTYIGAAIAQMHMRNGKTYYDIQRVPTHREACNAD